MAVTAVRLRVRLALALLAAPAVPVHALDGVVLLPGGRPAADATVSILGQTGSTRTGPDGRFRWHPDPPVPFQVLVILPGGAYAAPVLIESLPQGGGPVKVQLRAAVSESVTVSAGSTPHTEAPPASGATLVVQEDLLQRRPTRLADALDGIPGVSRLEEGHSAVPSIRGLARGRTLILIDGGRVTAERRAGPSATYLDPFFLEAVEVSRGFGSVAYGSDAFGGVIHARTRQATPGRPASARIQLGFGTGMPERSAAAELQKGFTEGGLILQGRFRDFDDYHSPRGRVGNSAARDAGGRIRLDHELGPGRLHLGWQTDLGRDTGKPATDSGVVRAYYPREDSHRLTLGYDPDPAGGFSRISLGAFLGWYRLVTDRDTLPVATRRGRLDRSDVRARDYGLRVSGVTSFAGWRFQGGLDFNGRTGLRALGVSEDYDTSGRGAVRTETAIDAAARHDAAVYATADGVLRRRLTTSAGVRFDRVAARNEGGFFGDRDTVHHASSGFVALTAGPSAGVTLTGQVGRGFRDPTLSDRFFRGVTGRGFVTGLPDLEPEGSLQYDIAVRRAGRVRAALYLYRYRIASLVERYRDGPDFFFRNRGSVVLRGVEVEAQMELDAGVSLELSAQAATGRAVDDDTPLADVPPEAITFTVRKEFGRGNAFVRAVLQAPDDAAGPTEMATPGHASLDASLLLRWRRLEARLLVRNLSDAAYPWSPDEKAVLAPARAALVTLAATF